MEVDKRRRWRVDTEEEKDDKRAQRNMRKKKGARDSSESGERSGG